MGTPEFAVPSLEILYNAGYEIVAVITSPDRLGGRGRKELIESDIKKFAKSKYLTILQPKNLKNEKFVEELKAYKADVQIVVAFRMLPEVVWNMPPKGTYNLHGSLLPKYRGAAPINWAIIKGEKTTGVTSFKLKHEIDTGSILFQKEIPIYNSDNASSLHDRMKYVAAEIVLKSVQAIVKNEINLKEQDNSLVSHAPKLKKENTQIDFNQKGDAIVNFVRGLALYPCAWTSWNGKSVKVIKCKFKPDKAVYSGNILTDNKNFVRIVCQNGWIEINELQYPGKRKMLIKEFLNGFDMSGLKNVDGN